MHRQSVRWFAIAKKVANRVRSARCTPHAARHAGQTINGNWSHVQGSSHLRSGEEPTSCSRPLRAFGERRISAPAPQHRELGWWCAAALLLLSMVVVGDVDAGWVHMACNGRTSTTVEYWPSVSRLCPCRRGQCRGQEWARRAASTHCYLRIRMWWMWLPSGFAWEAA